MTRHLLSGLTCLALLGVAHLAYAHAELLSADPPAGSSVEAPTAIRLTFDEPLVPGSAIVVYAAGFQPVPGLTPVVEGPTLRVALARSLSPGDYTVQWTALTADGHTTEGSYQFRVLPPRPGDLRWAWGLGAVLLMAGFGAILWRRRGHAPGRRNS